MGFSEMEVKKKRFTIATLVYIAFGLYVAHSMIRSVIGVDYLRQAMFYASLFLVVLAFCCSIKHFVIKNIIIKLIFIIFGFVSAIFTRDIALFSLAVFLSVSDIVDFDKVIKVDLTVKVVMLLLVVFLYFIGLTERVVMETKSGGAIYGLGFGNPNTFGVYVFGICADLIYLNRQRKSVLVYLFAILAAFFINVFCDSRSSFICILFLVVTSFYNPLKSNRKIIRIMLSVLPTLFFIISLALVEMYDNRVSFAMSLDSFLSRRIALSSIFLHTYKPTLLGNYFVGYNTAKGISVSHVLDNAYVMLISKFGIVATLLVLCGLTRQIYRSDEKNYRSVLCILAFAAFGLMENGLYILFYNPFLLSMSIGQRSKKGEKSESHKK